MRGEAVVEADADTGGEERLDPGAEIGVAVVGAHGPMAADHVLDTAARSADQFYGAVALSNSAIACAAIGLLK
jgi:hypothetical protein